MFYAVAQGYLDSGLAPPSFTKPSLTHFDRMMLTRRAAAAGLTADNVRGLLDQWQAEQRFGDTWPTRSSTWDPAQFGDVHGHDVLPKFRKFLGPQQLTEIKAFNPFVPQPGEPPVQNLRNHNAAQLLKFIIGLEHYYKRDDRDKATLRRGKNAQHAGYVFQGDDNTLRLLANSPQLADRQMGFLVVSKIGALGPEIIMTPRTRYLMLLYHVTDRRGAGYHWQLAGLAVPDPGQPGQPSNPEAYRIQSVFPVDALPVLLKELYGEDWLNEVHAMGQVEHNSPVFLEAYRTRAGRQTAASARRLRAKQVDWDREEVKAEEHPKPDDDDALLRQAIAASLATHERHQQRQQQESLDEELARALAQSLWLQ